MSDQAVQKFVDVLATQNERSAETVGWYLRDFETFAKGQLKTTPIELIKKIKEGTATDDPKEEQPYRILQQYATWIKKERIDTGENNAHTARLKISWARTLLESNFIPISRTIFKQLVKSPKPEEPELSPVDKNAVVSVITALDDIRLQSYTMWLASMGWRATESLSLQLRDFEGLNLKTLKFDQLPAFVNASGKSSKTKKGKRRQLTAEMTRQIEKLLAFNYRTRTTARKIGNKWTKITVSPTPKPEDRLFSSYHSPEELELIRSTNTKLIMPAGHAKLDSAYLHTAKRFREAIDRLGIGYEDGGKRRRFTLHTFRRFCFTSCSRALSESYAKYHIGRRVHEYDKRTPEQIAEDFATVEPFLTFLDSTGVELQHKALQRQIIELKSQLEEQGKGYGNYRESARNVYSAMAEAFKNSGLSDEQVQQMITEMVKRWMEKQQAKK